jgi:hypothetical protein
MSSMVEKKMYGERIASDILDKIKIDELELEGKLTEMGNGKPEEIKGLKEYSISELKGKRIKLLNGPEKVTLMMHLVNKQVSEMDQLMTNVLENCENEFYMTYKVSHHHS